MRYRKVMVDIFALALSHGLLALAAWRLMLRDDLDGDPAAPAAGQDGDEDGEEVGARAQGRQPGKLRRPVRRMTVRPN